MIVFYAYPFLHLNQSQIIDYFPSTNKLFLRATLQSTANRKKVNHGGLTGMDMLLTGRVCDPLAIGAQNIGYRYFQS